jgi:hypothetical protein
MKTGTLLKMCFLIVSAFFSAEISASDNLDAISRSPKLEASFVDSIWDGKTVPAGQQCRRYGGTNPATPRLLIKGIPPGANLIVMEYSDRHFFPMDDGGHGKIGFRIPENTEEIIIPSVPGHTFDLAQDFLTVAPHKNPAWDKAGAYMPPCSGGSGNEYYVTIKAVYQPTGGNREFKLLKWAELELGEF